jgi:hypothetical protein
VATEPAIDRVNIGFPVKCTYQGGHTALGKHGKHLRVEGGNIGYGEFSLTHSIPLDAVASIEVVEDEFGGSEAQTLVGLGTMNVGGPRRRGSPASGPKQVTEITVRTKDGQEAVWEVEHRGAEWVRERLTPVLRHARIPYYDELPPSARTVSL